MKKFLLGLLAGTMLLPLTGSAVGPTSSPSGAQPSPGAGTALAGRDWPEYFGEGNRDHYSTLTQINPANVGQLIQAWEFHTGDAGDLEANPLVVDGTLYSVTAAYGVFALDAATGRELWRYYADGRKPSAAGVHQNRGLTYWADGGDRRILFTESHWLWELDAATGRPIETFGDHGKTDLKSGLGETALNKTVYSTTPGTLVDDLIVMPTTVAEDATAALGTIQAFDVRTGKLAWTFRTIPAPGQPGYETWSKDAYKNTNVGSANSWPGMSVDRARDILYVPTGSAAPDFWGGDRKGMDLYANCLLALQGRTGRLLWYYQFVHHDLFDRDLPAPPNLVTLTRNGRKVDAVAQVTKEGRLFVFDRVTGAPLYPINEVPVPKSTLPGEESWPTQPIPTGPEPFTRQGFTEDDISPFAPNRDALIAKFREGHTQPFQPFGTYDTLIFPGFDGGAEWGGAAVDSHGILYVNANEVAYIATLRATPTVDELRHLSPGNRIFSKFCVQCHGADRAGNPLSGFPSLIDIGKRRSETDIMAFVATGAGRMPGFPMLSEQDRRDVADFLLGTEKGEGAGAGAAEADAAGEGDEAAERSLKPPPQPYILNGYQRFVASDGYPATRPPWGTLSATDLNTGRQLWRVPLGEFKELTARGIPQTGTPNYGGPVVTASGLLFIGAAMDAKLRAFDTRTGKILWEADLPAVAGATPSTYEAGGRQYVVIACGGGRGDTKEADSYVAFALPNTPQPLDVMPAPAHAAAAAGRLDVTPAFHASLSGASDSRIARGLDRLLRIWEKRSGLAFASRGSEAAELTVECAAAGPALPALGEDESYTLEISSSRAILRAPTTLGVLHGFATLQQLLRSDGSGWFLPAASIQDAPRFPWRGLMLDVSRHWEPADVIRRNLDAMALLKLNVFHFHLTDDQGFRVESKTHPELTARGSDGRFYTQEELRGLVAYAADRGIRIVPEFDLPGHATSWLVSHPEMASGPGPVLFQRHWGVHNPVVDPTNEDAYRLIGDVFGEMAAVFPDPYFHIGGDENNGVQWTANPRLQAFIKENNLGNNAGLQTYFNRRAGKILTDLGKHMVGWDEILHPELPRQDVIESWRGAESLAQAARMGFEGILAHGYYLDHCEPASTLYRADPLPASSTLSPEERRRILGGEVCMWGEWITPEIVDSRIWPRAAAVAERLWSPADVRNPADMYRRLELVDRRLDEAGLHQRSYVAPALKRLLGGSDDPESFAALSSFVDAVEPVTLPVRKYQQAGGDQWTPLIGVVDVARSDNEVSRHFADAVARWLAPHAGPRGDSGAVRAALESWKKNGETVGASLAPRLPGIAPAGPLAFQLSDAAEVGLEAVAALERGHAASGAWEAEALARLDNDAEPHAAAELAIVAPLRQLAAAAAGP